MRGAAAAVAALIASALLSGCAQTLTYEATGPGGAAALTQEWRHWAWPFIGNRDVNREARRLGRPGFEKLHEGAGERITCWRITTRGHELYSAEKWALEADLRDHIVLREIGKRASRVIDAEDLVWIESPREFDVRVREHTVRARRVEMEPGKRRITDYFGKIHTPGAGDAGYTPPRTGPADQVYGFDAENNAWPLDFILVRGFVEGADKSSVVMGSFRTIPKKAMARWEFDKEWGPWSYILTPYLAGRWVFSNKPYIARCEQFP